MAVLTDKDGNILGQAVLRTSEEWAVPTPVTYNATLTFKKPATNAGTITITEENPSGKPNAQVLTLPVTF
jgi:hypothetical protein